jgi:hypothetical protein
MTMSEPNESVEAPRLSAVLSGVAGEYFVAAELSRRGHIASLTLKNTRGVDILVSNADATRSVGIQVKAIQSRRPAWLLKKSAEEGTASNLFYVFVTLPPDESPGYYIVPAATWRDT